MLRMLDDLGCENPPLISLLSVSPHLPPFPLYFPHLPPLPHFFLIFQLFLIFHPFLNIFLNISALSTFSWTFSFSSSFTFFSTFSSFSSPSTPSPLSFLSPAHSPLHIYPSFSYSFYSMGQLLSPSTTHLGLGSHLRVGSKFTS